MPFLIVKGAFKFQHGEPDGDSVRFLAYNSSLFDRLRGRIRFKSKGEVQLRYEGIDAIEKEAKEPFSSNATKRNIELLKGDKNRKTGYILVNRTDKNGRPICFVFTGNPPQADGKEIVLRKDLLTESINYQLLSEGLVYPMFYDDLYQELRDVAIEVVTEARQNQLGIWQEDLSNRGFNLHFPLDFANLPPIFPKLWRRLKDFYSLPSNQHKTIEQFIENLERGSDRLYAIDDRRWLNFARVLEMDGEKLKLKYKPEEMIFRN